MQAGSSLAVRREIAIVLSRSRHMLRSICLHAFLLLFVRFHLCRSSVRQIVALALQFTYIRTYLSIVHGRRIGTSENIRNSNISVPTYVRTYVKRME